MKLTPYIQTIRTILIVAGIIAAVWFFKDWQFQKQENKRQSENASQLRKSDSLRFSTQNLTSNEIKEYLEYQNSDLKNKLAKEGIKLNRIESIISQTYKYQDTTKKETDLSGIVEAIRKNIPTSQEIIDTTRCMTTKGIISFVDNKLKFTVIDREFKNKSDAVGYWERRQWKFLGIKTRLFGRKEMTAKVFDQCGNSQVIMINKKK